jgi:hypothetical protein
MEHPAKVYLDLMNASKTRKGALMMEVVSTRETSVNYIVPQTVIFVLAAVKRTHNVKHYEDCCVLGYCVM